MTDENIPIDEQPVESAPIPQEVPITSPSETVEETVTKKETVSDEVEPLTVDPEVQEIEDKLRVFFQDVGFEEITALLETRNKILGKDEFAARVSAIGSYENLLASAGSDHSVEAQRILESIERIEDKALFESKLIRDGKVILTSFLTPRRASRNGASMTGRDARIEFAIKSGQMKRVPLYNSGFFIEIESPTLNALNNFFTKAHDDTNAYGRQFGANFFYFNDLLIKEAVVELVMPLVMGSSLNNWNRGGTLLRNIKLNDLKVILNSIAVLMFPDGFNFTHICKNPKGTCTYSEELLVDITKFFRQNFMKLPDENIEHMTKQDTVTQEKLAQYHERLNFKRSLRYDNIEFDLKVPSLEDYLLYGKKFNADLLKSNFADATVDVYKSLLFSFYQIYTPFIQTVTMYDSDGNKDIFSDDQDVIAQQLARLQSSDKERKFVKDVDAYIADTEISYICYPAVQCPKCGHTPPGSGYITVDPEHTFFIQSLTRLSPS